MLKTLAYTHPFPNFDVDPKTAANLITSSLTGITREVPKEGLEPSHPCGYQILSLARLPFRHFGLRE